MNKEEQFVLALKIAELSDNITEAKIKNSNAKLRCNFKKIAALAKLGIILSPVPIIGTILTCSNGWSPFKLNTKETYKLTSTTINIDGQEIVKEDYGEQQDENILHYYTACEPTENGNYKREIYSYKTNMTEEQLKSLMIEINSEERLSQEKIQELLKNYTFTQDVEYIPKMLKSDSDNSGYTELEIIKTDKSDIKITKESLRKHIGLEVLKLLIEGLFLAGYITYIQWIEKDLKNNDTNTDINNDPTYLEKLIKEIKSKPDYIDIKQMEQKLKAYYLIFNQLPYQSIQQEQFIEQQKESKELKL